MINCGVAYLHVLSRDGKIDADFREFDLEHLPRFVDDDVPTRTLGASPEDEEVVEIVELEVLSRGVAVRDE
jgi:hypothetical protein